MAVVVVVRVVMIVRVTVVMIVRVIVAVGLPVIVLSVCLCAWVLVNVLLPAHDAAFRPLR
jgi:hypothetical protein